MNRKNKAARAVNIALGLIVILAVVLMSPLFGFARGFSTPEQRAADAAAAEQVVLPRIQAAAATPRPTPPPTPTPVVLPSAPPTPEPTEPPVYTPAQQPNTAAYIPPAQQQWPPQQDWEGDEGEYDGEYDGEYVDPSDGEDGGDEWVQRDDTGGTINDSGVIANDNFDLIFQNQDNVSVAQDENPAFSYSGDSMDGDSAGGPTIWQEDNEGEVIPIQ